MHDLVVPPSLFLSALVTMLLAAVSAADVAAQTVTGPNQCQPTPTFPTGSVVCPAGQFPRAVLTETFDSGFGIFTEDPAPGGTNDLTPSTDGDTPSTGTGPETTAACDGSANLGEFIFLEGSFSLAGEEHCMSTTVDLGALSPPIGLSFWHYMFGDNIGVLSVDVTGSGVTQFTVNGQQQTENGQAWQQGFLNLSAEAGEMVTIEVCMSEGDGAISTFESDLSLDHLQIFNGCEWPIFSDGFETGDTGAWGLP